MVYFKQYYLGCLAHASYVLASEGQACIIDPQRDVSEYLTELEAHSLKLKYIIETHLHADFVSGHMELAARTGAQVVISHRAKAAFAHLGVKDQDKLALGNLELTILETPGHTPESICILAEAKEKTDGQFESMLFTGDTLFVGDVGRPDLVCHWGFEPAEMAAHLYDSLQNKILTLSDSTLVYPAHGAGSLCGKNISQERHSTIGEQKKFNWALKPMSKDEFIDLLTRDLPEVPKYFTKAVEKNRSGAVELSNLPELKELTAEETEARQKRGALLLDVRTADEFCQGHPAGALNIGLGGQFASFSGILVDAEREKIIVGSKEEAEEAVIRLARAGLENVTGYLKSTDGSPIETWKRAGLKIVAVPQLSVNELAMKLKNDPKVVVLDVRRKGEYVGGHVPGARSVPLSDLVNAVSDLDKDTTFHVICAGGYRSTMAVSLLLQHGFESLHNVQGGTMAWRKAGHDVDVKEITACQSNNK